MTPNRPNREGTSGPAVCAYAHNYLIDLKHAVITDVEANTCVRQAEVTAARMIERTAERGHAFASGGRYRLWLG